MKYHLDNIDRKINDNDLLFILKELRKGTLVRMPNNKESGKIYLKFLCPVCYEGGSTIAKFTNDDRRTFIKFARNYIITINSNLGYEISYTSSIKHLYL
ncbi:MAG: hypothetical protein WD512_19320 [Candidatus Paceibacterota bacterium]